LWKNITNTKGAEALANAAKKHKTELLPDITKDLFTWSIDLKDSTKILWHIFGDKSSTIETTIAKNANISTSKVGGLLKILAPIILTALTTDKKTDWSLDMAWLAKTLLTSGKSANNNSSLLADISIKNGWSILNNILWIK